MHRYETRSAAPSAFDSVNAARRDYVLAITAYQATQRRSIRGAKRRAQGSNYQGR